MKTEKSISTKGDLFQKQFVRMIEVEGLKEANNNYQDKPRFKF